jgi:LPXTG-site transpeptidase (sortase) family protein
MAIGIAMLAATFGLYGYGALEQAQFERGQVERFRIEAATATTESLRVAYETGVARGVGTATALAEPTALPTATPEPRAAASGPIAPAAPTPRPTATPAPPTPVPTPVQVVIRRITARSIGLDAEVVESKIENGEWQVPKFVAGHLEGTALPGGGSNVVLSGHVQSISSGNVFANIDKLKIGDEVRLRTTAGDVAYQIAGKNLVKNDDLSVVRPTAGEELTLITCAGTYNLLTQDYSERWVVWGRRVEG